VSVTRVEVEQILHRRCGQYLTEAGMSVQDGVNPWLTDPLRWALAMLGIESASIVAVTDTDLANVTRGQVDALLDLAELRALESVLTNLTDVKVSAGPLSVNASELPDRLATIIATKRDAVGAMHARLLVAPLDGAGETIARLRVL